MIMSDNERRDIENGGFLRDGLEGVRPLLRSSATSGTSRSARGPLWGRTLTVTESVERGTGSACINHALKNYESCIPRLSHRNPEDIERTQRLVLDLTQREMGRHRLRIAPRPRERDR